MAGRKNNVMIPIDSLMLDAALLNNNVNSEIELNTILHFRYVDAWYPPVILLNATKIT